MKYQDIFAYVQAKEVEFNADHGVFSNWSWNWKNHIEQSFFYKYGRLLSGNTDDKPVKNIVRPILNLAYRAEDIDIKDVNIYVDDPSRYHLSFLVKKYHDEVFVRKNDLDGFLDETKEEKIDYGGALVQKMSEARPKKVDLQTICFADRSDLMSAPFGILMPMTPYELMEMKEQGWGQESNGATISVEGLISIHEAYQAESYKSTNNTYDKKENDALKIYQVWGVLPAEFAGGDEGKYTLQLHYIAFLKSVNNQKIGVSLFSKEDKDKKRFKFVNRDRVHNRALGYGGVEELFESQAWTNSSMIYKMDMLRSASKTLYQTADSSLVARHPSGLKDLDNFEVIEHEENKPLTQVDTFPRNLNLFTQVAQEWEDHARTTGSAQDPLLGEAAPSGTPFRAQERQVIEGKGLHEYRREKYARFIEELYRDWWIPYIAKEITNGTKFLAELSSDELEFVANNLAQNQANEYIKEQILSGQLIDEEELAQIKQRAKEQMLRGGNKKFIEILKNELKDAPLKVQVDVAGKNKDLGLVVEKLTNVFRQIFANPAVLQDPRAQKVFNKMMEYSGLSQVDFTTFESNQMQNMAQQQIQAPQGQAVVPQANESVLQT